jgi:hypothetical protein
MRCDTMAPQGLRPLDIDIAALTTLCMACDWAGGVARM